MGVVFQPGKGKIIRDPLVAVVCSLVMAVSTPAFGGRSASARYVRNEIIIKLRANHPGQSAGAEEREKRLERLAARRPVRQVKALARPRSAVKKASTF